jgi:rod shape-determining protein MreD
MSLPLAAAGAIALALLELSVAPSVALGGLVPDLVFVAVVTISAVFGLERALPWAFVGGLMLDLLSAGPYRPLGTTPFTLLVVAAVTAAVARFVPNGRVPVTIGLAVILAIAYHLAILFFVSMRGVSVADPLRLVVPIALVDAVLTALAVAAAVLVERRVERQEGLGW